MWGKKAINKISQTTDAVGDLVSSHKEFIAKNIINTILVVIILFVFGCFDFAHLQIRFDYLVDANYWASVGTKAIADICSYNVGVNFIIDDMIKKDIDLKNIKSTYEALNSCKENDFNHYLTSVYNPKKKKEAYLNLINSKIYRLNKWSRRADRILYSSTKESDAHKKLKNKYCIKRGQLETLKTEEYINANLESLVVKFKDIDPSVFELEINGAAKVADGKVTGSISKGRVIASAGTFMGVVLISMLLNTFSLQPNKEEFENATIAAVHYVMKALTDIGVVVWQFFRGILASHGIVSKQLTVPYTNRVAVLKEYWKWRQEQGLWVPQCYLDLFKEKKKEEKPPKEEPKTEQEETEIEMTPEEYEQWKKDHLK